MDGICPACLLAMARCGIGRNEEMAMTHLM